MPQHDQVIGNDTGAAVRADIIAALAALFSLSSGTTEPSATVAYQWWADTTTGLLKIRNAANSAWVTVGTLADVNLGLLALAGGTMTGNLTLSADLIANANVTLGNATSDTLRVTSDVLELSANGPQLIKAGANGQPAAGVTHAGTPAPFGLYVEFTGAAPNDATQWFYRAVDTGGERATIRSNGGIANYSANDVNLCDRTTKSEHVVLDDAELDALEAAYIEVDWGRNKYNDQGHTDWNYSYTAQGVQRAFKDTAPALVDTWNPVKTVIAGKDERGAPKRVVIETPPEERKLGVYEHDMLNIGQALLARALKRIQALEQSQKKHA